MLLDNNRNVAKTNASGGKECFLYFPSLLGLSRSFDSFFFLSSSERKKSLMINEFSSHSIPATCFTDTTYDPKGREEERKRTSFCVRVYQRKKEGNLFSWPVRRYVVLSHSPSFLTFQRRICRCLSIDKLVKDKTEHIVTRDDMSNRLLSGSFRLIVKMFSYSRSRIFHVVLSCYYLLSQLDLQSIEKYRCYSKLKHLPDR